MASMRFTRATILNLFVIWLTAGVLAEAAAPPLSSMPRTYSIPTVDLADRTQGQVIVDREAGFYLGHPDTVLLPDGKTIYAAYLKGPRHGDGVIVLKKSSDGGRTWSERLPVPENWATAKGRGGATLYYLVDPQGKGRIVMFSCDKTCRFPIRLAVSEDDGRTWTPLESIGNFGGIVAMSSVLRLSDGSYMALFQDLYGRYIFWPPGSGTGPPGFVIYKTISADGGLTWNTPEKVVSHPTALLCEPCAIRSPDGKQIAVVMREQRRLCNSFATFSNDEGRTWSEPVELPASLTGDRHNALYAPDGRLVVVFRDRTHVSPTRGDFVAWVGTYDDIVHGREGQYRVRLLDNKIARDTGYAGFELLSDGTLVATTYVHFAVDEMPCIVSVRFRIEDIDARAAGLEHPQIEITRDKEPTPLQRAVRERDLRQAEQLIAAGADVNTRSNHGFTALTFAARTGQAEMAELLIAKGADVNATDDLGFTPLHEAAALDSTNVAKALIANGADVNAKDKLLEFTPLHEAANQGRAGIAELLLAAGAAVDAEDAQGRTPLQWATDMGNKPIVELILKHSETSPAKPGQ